MARKPRLHFPGAVYHVTLQGNARQQVFTDDIDRTRFLLLIQEGIEKFGHRVHAYCLLADRLRLVVEVDEVPLSRIMQQLGFRYTRWFNDWHGQIGHLFQGRYKAILIDPEQYLLPLVRDLHVNPLREKLAVDPMHYPWSSHRAYCGRETIPWLSRDRTFLGIEDTGIRALMKFHAYVNEGLTSGETIDFSTGGSCDPRILGEEDFVRGVMKLSRQKYCPKIGAERVDRLIQERFRLTEQELAAPGKNRACADARACWAWLYLETGCATLTTLADRLGRDVSSLSSAVRRLQLKAKTDPALADRLQKLLNRLQR